MVRQDGGGLEGGGAALAADGKVLRRSEGGGGGVVWFSMGHGRTLCAASFQCSSANLSQSASV